MSPVKLGVVCEARRDWEVASGLADRIARQLRGAQLELAAHRSWIPWRSSHPFLRWASVRDEARREGVRALGRFGGEAGAPDASAARHALLLWAKLHPDLDAVFLIRDTDCDEGRLKGLTQAAHANPWPFQVIVGCAESKLECWLLSGFDPTDEAEQTRLQEERRFLGFDPTEKSHLLRAATKGAKTNAKEALERLTIGDESRKRACWDTTPIDTLERRGTENGLSEYLRALRALFAPPA